MDVKVGRMNTIIGYNGFLAPYRPFYSSDYQFFYSQDGAFTGFLTDLHATKRLDIWNGMTFGANTFFTKRSSNSICYIGQVNYWLTDEQRTRLTASVYCRPERHLRRPGPGRHVRHDRGAARPAELEPAFHPDRPVQHGLGCQHPGRHRLLVWPLHHRHLPPEPVKLDANVRAEWFDDVRGTRTGINTNYSEVTLGLNWHPIKCLEIRPEIRGDFAGAARLRGRTAPTAIAAS